MVTRSRLVVFSLIILGVVSLSACMRPAPGPMRPESAAIGLILEKQWSKGGIVEYAARVYFIRWNDSADPTAQNEIIESNFSRGNRTYLLNAKPGGEAATSIIANGAPRFFRVAAMRPGALPSIPESGAYRPADPGDVNAGQGEPDFAVRVPLPRSVPV